MEMSIDYVHARNRHTAEGAAAAFPHLASFVPGPIESLVDVGCGNGPWLRAAVENGVHDVLGLDGVRCPSSQLFVDPSLITIVDLTKPLSVNRRFTVALCLEVAEHLDAEYARQLVKSLTELADTCFFSAACPGQPGQHHINCRWPCYWQAFFNSFDFTCHDQIRWALWPISEIEPWYRQNIFIAKRNRAEAGNEPRLASVVHPDLVQAVANQQVREMHVHELSQGAMGVQWYLTITARAMLAKLGRRISR
jgi:hypothetical protein